MQVESFVSGSRTCAPAVFVIGKYLKANVDEKHVAFGNFLLDDKLKEHAKIAVSFYDEQIKATKNAMRAWTLVGIRLRVVKDVRILIAKLIWTSGALYMTSQT